MIRWGDVRIKGKTGLGTKVHRDVESQGCVGREAGLADRALTAVYLWSSGR